MKGAPIGYGRAEFMADLAELGLTIRAFADLAGCESAWGPSHWGISGRVIPYWAPTLLAAWRANKAIRAELDTLRLRYGGGP